MIAMDGPSALNGLAHISWAITAVSIVSVTGLALYVAINRLLPRRAHLTVVPLTARPQPGELPAENLFRTHNRDNVRSLPSRRDQAIAFEMRILEEVYLQESAPDTGPVHVLNPPHIPNRSRSPREP